MYCESRASRKGSSRFAFSVRQTSVNRSVDRSQRRSTWAQGNMCASSSTLATQRTPGSTTPKPCTTSRAAKNWQVTGSHSARQTMTLISKQTSSEPPAPPMHQQVQYEGDLWVHYGQFYVESEDGEGFIDLDVSFRGQSNGICGVTCPTSSAQ